MLEDVKLVILEYIKFDFSKVVILMFLILKINGKSVGWCWWVFFVCFMMGEYEFYFLCKEVCEWFFMEFGDNSLIYLIGGNFSVGILIKEFSK